MTTPTLVTDHCGRDGSRTVASLAARALQFLFMQLIELQG